MITAELEATARALAAFLLLLALADPRAFHEGGLLLVVDNWLHEAGANVVRYVRQVHQPSWDWDSVRGAASRKGELRRFKRFLAARRRMRKYIKTWEARPEFAAAQKQHAGRRLAAVRGKASR